VNDGCHFEVPQFYCAEGVGLKNKKRNRLGKRGVVPTPPPAKVPLETPWRGSCWGLEPKTTRKGRAPVPREERGSRCAHDFQLNDATTRTRRFYGAAVHTIFQ
jgi:hypothetical protein